MVPALLRVGARPIASTRDVFHPGLRRAFPRYWTRRRWLLGASVVMVVVGAVAGVVLHWLVAVVAVAPFVAMAAWLKWRGRATWGARRSWPVGSVGVGTETMMHFEHFADAARRHGPVFKSNYFASPVVCVADLETATRILHDHEPDLGHRPLAFNRHVPGGAIRWAPEPLHTELRQLFARAMAPAVVNPWRPSIADIARGQLADGVEQSAERPIAPRGLLREAARQACSMVLLGVGPGDGAYPEVRERMSRLDICRATPVSDDETHDHLEWLCALVRERVCAGTDRSPRTVAGRLEDLQPGSLDDACIARNLVYLALGPRDDVAGLLTWVSWYLAVNPRWLDAVRLAGGSGRRDVAERIVSETLRLDQSEYVMRSVLRDFRVDGDVVPGGWLLRVCVREIHRDARNFTEPDTFDPDRFAEGAPASYAPLGIGNHSCIGGSLARAVAEEFVVELAWGFDLEPTSDGPREFSVNGHWAPSPEFRVTLTAREASRPLPT